VYGTGIEYRTLLDYRNRHGLENVDMRGFAPESRIPQIYDGFDVFMFPSLYEGFSLPILEAQARGLPVIICRRAKIPKETRRFCFEADDEGHAARMIRELRAQGYDKTLRRKAAAYAKSFTWSKTAEAALDVYKEVLGSR
jgi:glycosyltransferase involved in cell wall biosynthesis